LVGEGKGDSAFFQHLCDVRGVTGFQIEQSGGTGHFQSYLSGLVSRTNFDRLKALLVVGDNDETPTDSFNQIRSYLKKAKLPVPSEAFKVKRNHPEELAVVVLMIPFTKAGGATRGCLETVLLPAIEAHRPAVKACVDSYQTCLAANWTKNKTDKFRVRCSIAAMWPADPNFGLQFALEPARDMIPLTHPAFNEVVEFLEAFPAMVKI
jgi:hypothetical protein